MNKHRHGVIRSLPSPPLYELYEEYYNTDIHN